MEVADEKGIDKVLDARSAMSTVQAARRGKDPVWSCPCYFEGREVAMRVARFIA